MTTTTTAHRPAGSTVVASAQGFDQIAVASREFGWDIGRVAVARIWRGGAWGPGPFDNDTAADWATDLEGADVAARNAMIRDALTLAVEAQHHLHAPDAMAALAAAAVVSGARPSGWEDGSDYGPSPAALEGLVFDQSLRALAVRAVARVLDADSEWRRLWEDAGEFEEARTTLEPVLSALEDAPPAGT